MFSCHSYKKCQNIVTINPCTDLNIAFKRTFCKLLSCLDSNLLIPKIPNKGPYQIVFHFSLNIALTFCLIINRSSFDVIKLLKPSDGIC